MSVWGTIQTRVRTALTTLATDGLYFRRPPGSAWMTIVAVLHVARTGPWIQDEQHGMTGQPLTATLKVPDNGQVLRKDDQILDASNKIWTVTAGAEETNGQNVYDLKYFGIFKGQPNRQGAP